MLTAPSASPQTITPPVAIGGLGGSGTRVFATMLQHTGHHIGETLNAPLDNLWFTVLFKRAAWTKTQPDPREVADSVRLFTRAMTTGLRDTLDPADHALIDRLRSDLPPVGAWKCGAQAPHADALLDSIRPDGPPRPWGWKEPNTHIFLPHLNRLIPGLRYIHVVRNGLDMAFSDNTWQARHWSHLYGLTHRPDTPMPLHQLRFWIAANRAALDYGTKHMPGRFLAIGYEAFCADPEPNWHRIRSFLGAPYTLDLPTDLVRPTTIGRSAGHDLSSFPPDLLAAAYALQSELDR